MIKIILSVLLLLSFSVFGKEAHFGAKNCAQCHQKRYDKWAKTAHAKSSENLTPEQKKDPKCASCHNPFPDDNGVGCEACHGNGIDYAKSFVMKDKELAKKMGLKTVKQKTCSNCHNKYSYKNKPVDLIKDKSKICSDGE